ncbi:hypothetical protein [Desulfospira joergensenii]|uniref:hypothetical protein n=1 Tax=Desulfospira joergensenii TaxID=53329 RepID=UPI0003B4C85B|nr:hypothetical protein [Desulfospira joergensenii]
MIVVFFIFIAYWAFSGLILLLLLSKKKKKAAFITGTALFLLPIWDVMIGFLFVFVPASIFWSGNTIERQVMADTIHYDNFYRTYGPSTRRMFRNEFFSNKNKFAEMEVTEIREYSLVKEKGIYRFWLDKSNNIQFKKIDRIKARYTVRTPKVRRLPLIPIKFNSRIIIDRDTNEIIAQGNLVTLSYKPVLYVPFFSWLPWHDRSYSLYSNSHIEDLELDTINP